MSNVVFPGFVFHLFFAAWFSNLFVCVIFMCLLNILCSRFPSLYSFMCLIMFFLFKKNCLIPNALMVLGILYYVQLFFEVTQHRIPLKGVIQTTAPKHVFVSLFHTFLASFFWVLWICLFKTPLKYCTQAIFQGGSPWATMIFNSMIVLWVLYCVHFFEGNIFQTHVLHSFALAMVSYFLSVGFLLIQDALLKPH